MFAKFKRQKKAEIVIEKSRLHNGFYQVHLIYGNSVDSIYDAEKLDLDAALKRAFWLRDELNTAVGYEAVADISFERTAC